MGVFLALHAGSAITGSAALRDGPGSTARRFGRVRDAALRPIVMGMIEKAVLPVGNKIRVSAGAPPVTSADEFMRRAPLMLVASGKPFEYPQTNWGDAVQLIGPCMFEPATDTVPDWLEAIDRPIVLVTTSSQKQADAELVTTAMTALADEPVHVVATLPAGLPSDVTVGPNATVVEFVPQGSAKPTDGHRTVWIRWDDLIVASQLERGSVAPFDQGVDSITHHSGIYGPVTHGSARRRGERMNGKKEFGIGVHGLHYGYSLRYRSDREPGMFTFGAGGDSVS